MFIITNYKHLEFGLKIIFTRNFVSNYYFYYIIILEMGIIHCNL